jgi:VIT1/CCC1 family predicted Fe2+/Mn2+ transporter
MPTTPHVERLFAASETVRDAVIGMSDGLTVPFARATGLSAAVPDSSLIVTTGLAEVAAGAVVCASGRGIVIGLGGYLAARTDAQHYDAELAREGVEVEQLPNKEVAEVEEVLREYGLECDALRIAVTAITSKPDRWIDFMTRFEFRLERPDPGRAVSIALTIGGAHVVGGLVPLVPHMLVPVVRAAMGWSVVTTSAALLALGAVKGRFTGASLVRSSLQILLVGGLAAGAAFFLAGMFG